MRLLQELLMKARAVMRRTSVEREMEAEFAEHLAAETEDLISRGVPAEEARRRALTTMGRMEQIREECRDSRGTALWEQLKQDSAFAWRLLLKNRTYTLMALTTMALGIGSTTAVFSLIDGIFLRPLPFQEPERLYSVGSIGMRGPMDTLRNGSRLADYAGHLLPRPFTVTGRTEPERIRGTEVSANFFQLLGVQPILGRLFTEGEDRPGKLRKVILSHDFWKSRYEGRPNVIGEHMQLDEADYEIVGVMPAECRFPASTVNFWVPMRLDTRIVGEYWGMGGVQILARLRPGVQATAASGELRSWVDRIRKMFPWRMPDAWGVEANLTPLQQYLATDVRVSSLLLFGVVVLVLLIAVVNVANLMIGQTAARERELTLRVSLGATPGRLARQLLTESVVLAILGGSLGSCLAFGQLSLLKKLLPAATPQLMDIVIDQRILLFNACIAMGSGLLFGLLPAWRARSQRGPQQSSEARITTGKAGLRTDAALVVAEAAFATILLVGAGLLLHSFWGMLQVNPGFRTESALTAEISPSREVFASVPKTVALSDQLRLQLLSYPGVTHVATANILPLTQEISSISMSIEDHPRPPEQPQFSIWTSFVTADHFDALGIKLLNGRKFTDADDGHAQGVVVISKAMAHRFWPTQSPIGRRIRAVWQPEWRTIVGVVDDVKHYSIKGPPGWVDGEIYVPMGQSVGSVPLLRLVVRLQGDQGPFMKQLPSMVRNVCPLCVTGAIKQMDQLVDGAVQAPRSMASLVAGFAGLALMLAAAGIFGVVSHVVIRRTRELGVRLALGASRANVAWLVISASLRYTIAGTVVGLAVSWALTRWIRTLLFQVAEHDPISFSIAPLVLLIVALAATLLPIYRAVTIDPAKSLRDA